MWILDTISKSLVPNPPPPPGYDLYLISLSPGVISLKLKYPFKRKVWGGGQKVGKFLDQIIRKMETGNPPPFLTPEKIKNVQRDPKCKKI